jgi:hypothetical protein
VVYSLLVSAAARQLSAAGATGTKQQYGGCNPQEVKVYGECGPHEVNVLRVPPAGCKSTAGVTCSKLCLVRVEPAGETDFLRGAFVRTPHAPAPNQSKVRISSKFIAAHAPIRPAPGAAHGAIKAYFLVLTTCTRVQTILLHPHTRTDRTTQSVQLYRWDDPFRTNVHPRRVDADSCTARITPNVQLCGRAYACRTVVRSDSFAMHSSTYDLAGSGLTFEIMRFGSNTCRIF